jgi:hypothetical protein
MKEKKITIQDIFDLNPVVIYSNQICTINGVGYNMLKACEKCKLTVS